MKLTKHDIESEPKALGLDLIVKLYDLRYKQISAMTRIAEGSLHNYGHYGVVKQRVRLDNGKMIKGIKEIQKHIEDHLKNFGLNDEEISCLWLPIKDAAEKLGCISEDFPTSSNYNINSHGMLNNKNDILIKYIGVKMLTEQTLKLFGLSDNPFNKYESDIVEEFWAHDNYKKVIKQMVDAGKNGGFLAVVGPVGGGKTTCAQMARFQLEEDGITVVQPLCKTGKYAKPSVINSAIIDRLSILYGLDEDGSKKLVPSGGEHSMTIVRSVLERTTMKGSRCALFIEEAHLLHIDTLKHLKQLKELTMQKGRKVTQLISIILIGQKELENKLHDISAIQEVGIRVSDLKLAAIPPADAMSYLVHKFKLVDGDWNEICEEPLREELSFDQPLLIITPQRLNITASALLDYAANNYKDKLTLKLYWKMLQDKGVSYAQIRKYQADNEKRKKLSSESAEQKKKTA